LWHKKYSNKKRCTNVHPMEKLSHCEGEKVLQQEKSPLQIEGTS